MEEQAISARVQEILEAYSTLPQMSYCDLSLEEMENGDVNVTISYKADELKDVKHIAERTIKHNESLDFISESFNFPSNYGLNSPPISPIGLKEIYFDLYGDLITRREDHTEERFRVNAKHREAIESKLKESFGSKFKTNHK